MAIYDLRILLETVGGKKTSYFSSGSSYAGGSGSFVDTDFDGLVLSSSQAYDRITGSVSCSFVNDEVFIGEVNPNFTFVQNSVLSSSLLGNQTTGSILFTALTDEYDRLLRYKFIGDKVCTVLGLPSNQWVYVDQFRLPADDESNIIKGNMNIGNAFVSDTITFANNANVNSDIPFYIDTGSDRYIKFIDTRDEGKVSLIFGYDKDTDTYEINASTGSIFNIKNLNELDVDRINAAQVNMVTSSTETSLATSFTNMVVTGSLFVSGSESEEPLLRIRGNISSSGDIITTGDVIAKNYIVSSSITQITTSFSEGNTIFGDSSDDIHQFTGSVDVLGSIDTTGNISSSATITALSYGGDVSGSISSTGSFGKVEGSGSANESFLQQTISTTLNSDVGAISTGTTISAGTSIESILRQILIDFIPPTFTAFAITGLDTNIEVGDTEPSTINAGTFTTGSSASDNSGFENNGGSFQLSLSGNATDDGNISATYAGNSSGTITLSSAITVKRTSVGEVTFTLTGTDSNSNVTTRTDIIRFRHPIFYGGSSNNGAGLNDSVLASVLADISSSVSSDSGTNGIVINTTSDVKFGDQTLIEDTAGSNLPNNTKIKLPSSVENSSNFTYIIYPNSYGDLTQILKNDVQDETSTFNKLGTAEHERYSGVDTTYVVYRSSGQQAFDENDTLTLND